MKLTCLSIATIAALCAVTTAFAELGDNESTLTEHYGQPKSIEKTTGDIPTQKGYYVELREINTTNSIWMAPPRNGHYLELIEKRDRYSFLKDGMWITAYPGEKDEKYGGIDFSGKSAREIIDGPVIWMKNKDGDKYGHPTPLPPEKVTQILDENKGGSAWSNDWQLAPTPGRYVKWTADKTREAILYGRSTNEVSRLEIKMANEVDNPD